MLWKLLFGALAAACTVCGGPAFAEVLSTRYNVALIGLPVGRASFQTEFRGAAYSVDGTLSSVGLADIVSTVKGTSKVAGRINGNRLFATTYALDYSSDKRHYKSDVTFRAGRVASAAVQPEPRQQKDYIPVTKNQLRSVLDPLSGLMIKPGKATGDLCQRTLPFFDGWSRLDLQLSSGGTKPFVTDGFSGDATVCKVRVQPISGFKPTSKGVQFIARQTLEIWFAPIRETGIYAPVYARVPTEIGPLTFRATTFAKP